MSLLDEAVKLQSTPGGTCSVGNLKKSDPALYAELIEALASSVQFAAISRALKEKHQIVMASSTLSYHRRGDCAKCRS